MNTQITEQDIIAWFKSMRDKAAIPNLRVGFDTGYHKVFTASIKDSYKTEFADSLMVAIEATRATIKKPADIAKEKREAAAKLMAEADAIEDGIEQQVDADEGPQGEPIAAHTLERDAMKEAREIEKYGMPEPWERV